MLFFFFCYSFFFQAEDGIRDLVRSRGLGDVYKRQKFTIAEAYTAARGDTLTSEAQRRYLYGDGTPWDITDDLEAHILSPKGPYRGVFTRPRDAWIHYYRDTLQNAINLGLQRPKSLSFDIPKPVIKRNVRDNAPFHWSIQGVTGSASRDILNTLGDYTIYSEADVTQSRASTSGSGAYPASYSTSTSRRRASRRTSSPPGRPSTGPRSAASRPSTSPT